jgi:hypothetical protein
LPRTDPDPRVRHRADAPLALAHGRTVEETAQAMGCCSKRIRVWRLINRLKQHRTITTRYEKPEGAYHALRTIACIPLWL